MERSLFTWLRQTLEEKPVHGLAWGWRFLLLATLGTVMGTVLDAFHVFNKTAGYQHVALLPVLNVAVYVPFEFATAGVVVGMTRPRFDEELHRTRSDLPLSRVLAGMVTLAVTWYGSGALTRLGVPNPVIAVVLGALAIACWLWLDRSAQGALAAFITGGIGVAVESALVQGGTYYYVHPDVWGVPCWLPMLYGVAAVAVGNLGRYLKYSWDMRPPEAELPAVQRAA